MPGGGGLEQVHGLVYTIDFSASKFIDSLWELYALFCCFYLTLILWHELPR